MMRLDDKPPLTARLISGEPVRRIGRQRRSLRGHVEVHGTSVEYKSALERDLLVLLDFDYTVAQVVGQPVQFNFRHPVTGRQTHYTPDVYARYEGDRPRVNAGVKMHRRAGVKHHYRWWQQGAPYGAPCFVSVSCRESCRLERRVGVACFA